MSPSTEPSKCVQAVLMENHGKEVESENDGQSSPVDIAGMEAHPDDASTIVLGADVAPLDDVQDDDMEGTGDDDSDATCPCARSTLCFVTCTCVYIHIYRFYVYIYLYTYIYIYTYVNVYTDINPYTFTHRETEIAFSISRQLHKEEV